MTLSLSKSANFSFSLRSFSLRQTDDLRNEQSKSSTLLTNPYLSALHYLFGLKRLVGQKKKGDVGLRLTCCNNIVSIKG